MKDPFRYTFRFCSDPSFRPEKDMADLERFVQEACIDDVAMFVAPQDLSTGHLSLEELEEYAAWFRQVQAMLEKYGVTLSVNQWYSIMHEDLGQHLRPGQDFGLMVDRNGRASESCVCPADPAWQQYFCESYAHMAKLEPEILWVEDDFRYHNHAPLDWGGCFCDRHMEIYSQKAGKPLTREEFVAGVIAPGEAHPYRKIWLDTCREVQEQVAERLGAAVRAVSANTKVGLMSSAPYMHATEGRHWAPLVQKFAAGAPSVDRIHLPGYVEPSAREYMKNFNMVSMQTRHFLPPECEIYPELEDYPYSLFTKSLAFTRFQMLASLPLAERGVAMNLFDLNGNGIVFEENWQRMLREVKPFLNELTADGAFFAPPAGVKVMCSEDASYSLHTERGESMLELCPGEVFFAGLLPAMGIPFAYCSDKAVQNSVLAVSGQYFRGLTAAEVERLFAGNFVLLSGDALETLCSMGLGHLAGVKRVRWMRMNSGEFAYEQGVDIPGEPFAGNRASNCIFCCDALRVEFDGGHMECSRFYDAWRRPICPAQTVVEGRVMVYPFGHFGEPTYIPPMLLGRTRQQIMQFALSAALGAAGLPVVLNAPQVIPYYYEEEGRSSLYLVNATNDPIEGLQVRAPGLAAEAKVACRMSAGSGQQADALEGKLVLRRPLPPLEAVLLRWQR